MLHRKMVIAIALALIIVLSSFPAGWAGGPADNTTGGVIADGGDGHPWDDGTSEQTSPGDNPDGGVTVEESAAVEASLPAMGIDHSFAGWIQAGLYSAWKALKQELEHNSARKTMTRRSVK